MGALGGYEASFEGEHQLALAHPDDIDAYMDGRDAFIKEHELRAMIWMKAKDSHT